MEIVDTQPVSGDNFDTVDLVVVLVYFIIVVVTGLSTMWRGSRGTLQDYFMANRSMSWLPVGASLFASNIGALHFIGLAGTGASSGVAVGAFELNALIVLQVLGWVFLPVFIRCGVDTLPEYMTKRFGGVRIRMYLAILSLVLYIFTKISVDLYAGALFIKLALQWNLYLSIILLLGLTALCTIFGGLTAVIYTDTLQFFIINIGGLTLMALAMKEVGGWNSLVDRYMVAFPPGTSANSSCGVPREDSWKMLRDPVDSDLPWVGFLLGQTPASIWYWCADQVIVQRVLAAKSLSHAQGGTIFAGFMKILPVFVIVIPGMISRVLFPREIACFEPQECMEFCGNPVGCSNIAYPKLVLNIMPSGIRGLMMAVMLSALMSDLTSIFSSSSTLFTLDIWKHFRKAASDRELLLVGRLFVLLLVLISMGWIPLIEKMQGGQLFIYISAVSAYLAPPVAAVYTLAIFWRRMNESGAFWSLFVGFFMGVIRMALDFIYPEPTCLEEDVRPMVVSKVHYMYFAAIAFWCSLVIAVVVSLLTEPPPGKLTENTVFRYKETDKARGLHLTSRNSRTPLQLEEEGAPYAIGITFGDNQDHKAEMVEDSPTETRILRQTWREKVVLNVGLVVICVVDVFLYLYFTFGIHPTPPSPLGHPLT